MSSNKQHYQAPLKKAHTDTLLKIGSTPTPHFGLDVRSLDRALERDLDGVTLHEQHKKSKKSSRPTNGLVERIFPQFDAPSPSELNQLFRDSRGVSTDELELFLIGDQCWNTKLWKNKPIKPKPKAQPGKLSHTGNSSTSDESSEDSQSKLETDSESDSKSGTESENESESEGTNN